MTRKECLNYSVNELLTSYSFLLGITTTMDHQDLKPGMLLRVAFLDDMQKIKSALIAKIGKKEMIKIHNDILKEIREKRKSIEKIGTDLVAKIEKL